MSANYSPYWTAAARAAAGPNGPIPPSSLKAPHGLVALFFPGSAATAAVAVAALAAPPSGRGRAAAGRAAQRGLRGLAVLAGIFARPRRVLAAAKRRHHPVYGRLQRLCAGTVALAAAAPDIAERAAGHAGHLRRRDPAVRHAAQAAAPRPRHAILQSLQRLPDAVLRPARGGGVVDMPRSGAALVGRAAGADAAAGQFPGADLPLPARQPDVAVAAAVRAGPVHPRQPPAAAGERPLGGAGAGRLLHQYLPVFHGLGDPAGRPGAAR